MGKCEVATKKQSAMTKALRATGDGLIATGKFIQKHSAAVMICMMSVMMIGSVVFADGAAEEMWTKMTALVSKWVLRLGGVVVFVGAIMFALGWKDDDAEKRTRGIQTMVAGAMVAAIAGGATLYMNYGGGGDGGNG